MAKSTSKPNLSEERLAISIDDAHSLGADQARQWMTCHQGGSVPASVAKWRPICYAAIVNDISAQDDFLSVLHSWEVGFDDTLRAAGFFPTGDTPAAPANDDGVILRDARLQKFKFALYDIFNANKALCSSTSLFPRIDLADTGEIDADVAIEAFCDLIEKRLNVLLRIVENEDKTESEVA